MLLDSSKGRGGGDGRGGSRRRAAVAFGRGREDEQRRGESSGESEERPGGSVELSGVDSAEGKGGRQAGAWRACARSPCPPSPPPGKEEDDWLGQLGRARPHSAGPAQELAAGKVQVGFSISFLFYCLTFVFDLIKILNQFIFL